MKDIEDDKLDDFFRTNTKDEGNEPPFDHQAWNSMEKKLNKRDRVIFFKRASFLILLLLGSGAALHLYQIKSPESTVSESLKTGVEDKKHIPSLVSEDSRIKKLVKNDNQSKSSDKEIKIAYHNSTTQQSKFKVAIKKHNSSFFTKKKKLPVESDYSNIALSINHETADSNLARTGIIDAQTRGLTMATKLDHNKPMMIPDKAFLEKENEFKQDDESDKDKIKKSPTWGFAVLFGPENTTLSDLNAGKINLNTGLLLTAKIAKRWLFSTGLAYGVKNYNASAHHYHFGKTYAYKIDNIAASCDILEIPLRASYLISNKKSSSLSFNTGLSTLFMLKEKYIYQYETQLQLPNRVLIKKNSNQHYFSVLELSSTYAFKVKSGDRSNLGITPFVKLPLTGIGQGKVHLKSTGINLSYNYDFNKKTK